VTSDRERAVHGLVLLFPAVLLGLLVGTQFRSQGARPLAATRYNVPLVEAATGLQQEQAELKIELAQLRSDLDDIQARESLVGGQAAALHQTLDRLRADAGLTSLSGQGITVTLDDGRVAADSPRGTIELAIVHSSDLTDVVNAAWRSGAVGVAINGERITASSACVGAVIQINGTLLSPPFVVSVVGPRDRLAATFADAQELRDLKQRHDAFGLGLQIRGADAITLPPYIGPIRARYATVP
jgi:uncharacterized protein YlxW (UPF0749 family)